MHLEGIRSAAEPASISNTCSPPVWRDTPLPPHPPKPFKMTVALLYGIRFETQSSRAFEQQWGFMTQEASAVSPVPRALAWASVMSEGQPVTDSPLPVLMSTLSEQAPSSSLPREVFQPSLSLVDCRGKACPPSLREDNQQGILRHSQSEGPRRSVQMGI